MFYRHCMSLEVSATVEAVPECHVWSGCAADTRKVEAAGEGADEEEGDEGRVEEEEEVVGVVVVVVVEGEVIVVEGGGGEDDVGEVRCKDCSMEKDTSKSSKCGMSCHVVSLRGLPCLRRDVGYCAWSWSSCCWGCE